MLPRQPSVIYAADSKACLRQGGSVARAPVFAVAMRHRVIEVVEGRSVQTGGVVPNHTPCWFMRVADSRMGPERCKSNERGAIQRSDMDNTSEQSTRHSVRFLDAPLSPHLRGDRIRGAFVRRVHALLMPAATTSATRQKIA